jgi:hypothetical protein
MITAVMAVLQAGVLSLAENTGFRVFDGAMFRIVITDRARHNKKTGDSGRAGCAVAFP